MFARALVLVLLWAGAVVRAQPARATGSDGQVGGDSDELTISAKDLKKYFAPYVPAVRDCYAANAHGHDPTGELRLELVIHRDGSVFRFGFKAPGILGAWLRKLDHCLRKLSESWHFPMRRGFTTAVIPFHFQRTLAPGAGPWPGRSPEKPKAPQRPAAPQKPEAPR